jgi:hypothetical protein
MCLTEIRAVALIQGSLESVCREERGRGLKREQALLVEREKISWNPAEIEET